ncbi:hypothetical protein AKO53_02830 [Brucella abortus]|uniref:Uncharacterized protein n=2 Tax=Brucella TaxID=234 RepID=A0AAI8E9V7_BRUSS|nr:hypothetical protein AWH03_11070 [Brucella suis 019]AOG42812.1 hypothetical protein BFL30_14135 [Brucella canis]APY16244.1 hypothetical protein BKD02_17930 [Brucella sp. 09RB8910]ASU73857.1 hypothetical protein CJP69_15175 [Brucella abortus]ATQ54291.1 hypothetical protein CS875_14955 [Brucella suis]AUS48950.1 hypothetical protein C0R52_13350 [Brucella melitensis]EEW81649.1 predicted protein [Brucella abortus NCTC 8038]EEX78766.1 predicted protein [Brucella abortus bv. 9 str. C68]EEZ06384
MADMAAEKAERMASGETNFWSFIAKISVERGIFGQCMSGLGGTCMDYDENVSYQRFCGYDRDESNYVNARME